MAIPKSQVAAYRLIDAGLRASLRRLPYSPLTERIALAWGYRFRPEARTVRLRSGAVMQLTHIDHLQLLLYYLGTFEPRALDAMRERIGTGSTVLDVGANIGLFTIEAAQAVGATGNVISIEALPKHAETVRSSVEVNRMRGVEVHATAVGEASGTAVLTRPADSNAGMFTLGSVDGSETHTVPVRRIDDIVAGRRIDFIKMDIEGSEYKALLGAAETLKQKPPILIELNGPALRACGSSPRQIKQLLADHGYRGRIIGARAAITIEQDHECDECLFLAA